MVRGIVIVTFFFLTACNLFTSQPDEEVVAKAGKHLLYKSDIQGVAQGLSGNDSVQHVRAFINNWATKMLLLDKAEINLSAEQQAEFDVLVENYKTDLYTKAYVDMIAARALDTHINELEYENFYLKNRQNFFLNETLIQWRYIQLDPKYSDISKVKEALYRYNENDKAFLEDREIQFTALSLNDTSWVSTSLVAERVPIFGQENFELLLKNNSKIELQDSLGVYLAFVKNVLDKNEIAPLSYIKPAITRIILNQRKIEIIRNFEKDILQDAYKNKSFEIYE